MDVNIDNVKYLWCSKECAQILLFAGRLTHQLSSLTFSLHQHIALLSHLDGNGLESISWFLGENLKIYNFYEINIPYKNLTKQI